MLSCYLTSFKFDAELFNLHISLPCILKKTTKIFSFLPQNPAFRYSGIFCEMYVLLLLVYLDIAILDIFTHKANC